MDSAKQLAMHEGISSQNKKEGAQTSKQSETRCSTIYEADHFTVKRNEIRLGISGKERKGTARPGASPNPSPRTISPANLTLNSRGIYAPNVTVGNKRSKTKASTFSSFTTNKASSRIIALSPTSHDTLGSWHTAATGSGSIWEQSDIIQSKMLWNNPKISFKLIGSNRKKHESQSREVHSPVQKDGVIHIPRPVAKKVPVPPDEDPARKKSHPSSFDRARVLSSPKDSRDDSSSIGGTLKSWGGTPTATAPTTPVPDTPDPQLNFKQTPLLQPPHTMITESKQELMNSLGIAAPPTPSLESSGTRFDSRRHTPIVIPRRRSYQIPGSQIEGDLSERSLTRINDALDKVVENTLAESARLLGQDSFKNETKQDKAPTPEEEIKWSHKVPKNRRETESSFLVLSSGQSIDAQSNETQEWPPSPCYFDEDGSNLESGSNIETISNGDSMADNKEIGAPHPFADQGTWQRPTRKKVFEDESLSYNVGPHPWQQNNWKRLRIPLVLGVPYQVEEDSAYDPLTMGMFYCRNPEEGMEGTKMPFFMMERKSKIKLDYPLDPLVVKPQKTERTHLRKKRWRRKAKTETGRGRRRSSSRSSRTYSRKQTRRTGTGLSWDTNDSGRWSRSRTGTKKYLRSPLDSSYLRLRDNYYSPEEEKKSSEVLREEAENILAVTLKSDLKKSLNKLSSKQLDGESLGSSNFSAGEISDISVSGKFDESFSEKSAEAEEGGSEDGFKSSSSSNYTEDTRSVSDWGKKKSSSRKLLGNMKRQTSAERWKTALKTANMGMSWYNKQKDVVLAMLTPEICKKQYTHVIAQRPSRPPSSYKREKPLDKKMDTSGPPPVPQKTKEQWLTEANRCLVAGEINQCLIKATMATDLDESYCEALLLRAEVYIMLGLYSQAQLDINALLRMDGLLPQIKAKVLMMRANVHLEADQVGRAMEDAEQLIMVVEKLSKTLFKELMLDARILRIKILDSALRPLVARAEVEDLKEEFPDHWKPYYESAQLALVHKRTKATAFSDDEVMQGFFDLKTAALLEESELGPLSLPRLLVYCYMILQDQDMDGSLFKKMLESMKELVSHFQKRETIRFQDVAKIGSQRPSPTKQGSPVSWNSPMHSTRPSRLASRRIEETDDEDEINKQTYFNAQLLLASAHAQYARLNLMAQNMKVATDAMNKAFRRLAVLKDDHQRMKQPEVQTEICWIHIYGGIFETVRGNLPVAEQEFDHCLKIDEVMPEAYALRGEVLLLQGKNVFALQDLRRALMINPDMPAVWHLTAMLYLEKFGDLASASLCCEELLKIQPFNVRGLHLRAEIYDRKRLFKQATTEYNRITHLAPYNAPTYLLRARTFLHEFGDQNMAMADLQRFVSTPRSNKLHAKTSKKKVLRRGFKQEPFADPEKLSRWNGQVRLMNKQYHQAAEEYSKAVASEPSPENLKRLAESFLGGGFIENALKAIEKAVQIVNEEEDTSEKTIRMVSNLAALKARCLFVDKHFEAALLHFDNAVQIDQKNTEAIFFRGLCKAIRFVLDREKAVQGDMVGYKRQVKDQLLQEEINRMPWRKPKSKKEAGKPKKGANRMEFLNSSGINDFRICLQRNPDNLRACLLSAELYIAGKEWEHASSTYADASKIDPYNETALNNKAALDMKSMNFALALSDLNTAVMNGGSSHTHYNRGLVNFAVQNFEAAEDDFTKAIMMLRKRTSNNSKLSFKENSMLMSARKNRGIVRMHRGKLQKAISDFEKVNKTTSSWESKEREILLATAGLEASLGMAESAFRQYCTLLRKSRLTMAEMVAVRIGRGNLWFNMLRSHKAHSMDAAWSVSLDISIEPTTTSPFSRAQSLSTYSQASGATDTSRSLVSGIKSIGQNFEYENLKDSKAAELLSGLSAKAVLGSHGNAWREYTHALHCCPAASAAWLNLGLVASKLGVNGLARRLYSSAQLISQGSHAGAIQGLSLGEWDSHRPNLAVEICNIGLNEVEKEVSREESKTVQATLKDPEIYKMWPESIKSVQRDNPMQHIIESLSQSGGGEGHRVNLARLVIARGVLEQKSGKPSKALQDYRSALLLLKIETHFEVFSLVHYNMATVYLSSLEVLENQQQAFAHSNQAIQLTQQPRPWLYIARGCAHFALGNLPEAINDFENAQKLSIKDQPGNTEDNEMLTAISVNFAACHKFSGSPALAKEHISRAMEITPVLPILYIERGQIEADRGNISAAMTDFATAIHVDEMVLGPK